MRLATIISEDREFAAVISPRGAVPICEINSRFGFSWSGDLFSIIQNQELDEMVSWFNQKGNDLLEEEAQVCIPRENLRYGPLFRHPSKIWGIGLNYVDHASDLAEKAPSVAPASFMKPDTTIIGPGEDVLIPLQSEKTTGEAELGIIMGKRCRNVKREDWLSVVAGFTTIIDMTAEDILRINPRYLTMSKSFDSFFSFGPQFVTPDEIPNVNELKVSTMINGNVHASNVVSNMTFPPDYLVSFHSDVMTLLPGDIISTGTPRAVPLSHGDTVGCCIDGFESLFNPVKDLKKIDDQ